MNKKTIEEMINKNFLDIESLEFNRKEAQKIERKRKIVNAISTFIEYSLGIVLIIMLLSVLFLIAHKLGTFIVP